MQQYYIPSSVLLPTADDVTTQNNDDAIIKSNLKENIIPLRRNVKLFLNYIYFILLLLLF